MAYTPNPVDALAPLDTEAAGTAAAEFRALKLYLQGVVAGATASGPSGSQLSHRNKFLNPKFLVNQDGTNFPSVSSGVHISDGWRHDVAASVALLTGGTSTDVPSNEFQSSLGYTATAADAATGAGEYIQLFSIIEGYNVQDLKLRTFTLSFWVKATVIGTYCVNFRNSNSDRSYIAEYTVNASNVWEKKTIVVTGGLATGSGTWNFTNAIGVSVGFAAAAGSSFTATANIWNIGNKLATANQVNAFATVGNVFRICGPQIEAGAVATPFEHRSYTEYLLECYRYYWRSAYVAVAGYNLATGVIYTLTQFPVKLRITNPVLTPITVVYSNASALVVAGLNDEIVLYQTTTTATGYSLTSFDLKVDARL